MIKKDDYALVLDYLANGYPLSGNMKPVVQAIGTEHLALLELAPIRGAQINVKEKVYIGPEKRDKIYYIIGRLPVDKMTEAAKIQLQEFVEAHVGEHEGEFVKFFNSAQAINTRLHQLELLPGFGRKHTQELLNVRNEKPFDSFEEIRQRVKSVPDPKKAVEKRIIEELTQNPRQRLFVR
jgi:putative nucleotide binding protein